MIPLFEMEQAMLRVERMRIGFSALVLSTICSVAGAQEVTLKSSDGTVNLSGELLDFDGATYKIETFLGEMNVSASMVECEGDGCPNFDLSTLQPVTWSVSLWGSRRAFTEHVEKLAELVSEKTEGQFRLNISYGGLSPSRENLDGISKGAFEMAQFCAGYHPDKNPSITVLELPFLGVSSMEKELAVSQAVYNHPAVVEDLARWNATLLMPTPQPQYNIAGVGSPPTSLASFQNMTVRATGGSGVAINALGADTISIPADQVRDALSNGDVNAVAFAPHAHMAFNTVDSALWWTTNLNPGTANCPIVANSEALSSLPAAYRVALMSSTDEALEHFIANYTDSTLSRWETELEDRAIIQLSFSESMLSAINNEVAGPAAQNWIEENQALGLPAQELYNLVTDTLGES